MKYVDINLNEIDPATCDQEKGFFQPYFKKVANMLDAFDSLEKKSGDYKEDEELEVVRHKTIKDVTRMLDNFQFNTAVAKMMEFRTAIANYQKGKNRSSEYEKAVLVDFVKLLAPLAPHYMEEVWSKFGNTDTIFNAKWPEFDEAKTISKEIEEAWNNIWAAGSLSAGITSLLFKYHNPNDSIKANIIIAKNTWI